MLTQNTWCWWAGGVPWGHHFVGSNPHGCYHFVGVPIPFCRGVGWAPYTLVGPTSRGEFQGGSMGYVFSRKWLGLLPRVDHFVDWCRSEDRPCFYDCVEKSSGKELWLNLFLLDPSGSSRILQLYPNFDSDCSLEDLCQNSILLLIFVFALGPFLWLEHTGTGKSFHLQKDCQHIVGKQIEKYSCCKSCMKKWIHLRKGGVKTTRG